MGNWKIIVNGSTKDFASDYNFNVQQMLGAGMPSLNNVSTDFGLLDGALFQRTRVDVRELTLVGYINGSSVADLHTKRRNFLNTFKSDRSASADDPVVIQYTGGASTLQASAFYSGGFELNNIVAYDELDIGLRFQMFDPYWQKTTSTSATLTTSCTVSNANRILQRNASGHWSALGTGLTLTTAGAPHVTALVTGSGTTLFAAGFFSQAGGTAACCIAKWDGATWTGMAASHNGEFQQIAFDPAGATLYTVGLWTSFNASTVRGIVKWNGSTWAKVSSGCGLAGDGYSLVFGTDGVLYAGGNFPSVDATTACNIAKYNGTAWSAMDTGLGINAGTATVRSLVRGLDGAIYAGGVFNLMGSGASSASFLARWNGTAWSMPASGTNNPIFSLAVGTDGTIYAGGNFTKVGASTLTACNIAKTNTTTWSKLGLGVNSTVDEVYYDTTNDLLYTAGNFTLAGSVATPGGGAVWTGGTWTPLDVTLPGGASILAFNFANDKLTIGFTASGTASTPGVTAITNNGTATAYPILTACAPTSTSTQLYQLINYTSNDRIYFNLTLAAGEVVTLDLRPGAKTFTSNFRGNIINTIAPGSNVATWKLLPGTNSVSFFLSGGSGAGKLEWTERFWSLDN